MRQSLDSLRKLFLGSQWFGFPSGLCEDEQQIFRFQCQIWSQRPLQRGEGWWPLVHLCLGLGLGRVSRPQRLRRFAVGLRPNQRPPAGRLSQLRGQRATVGLALRGQVSSASGLGGGGRAVQSWMIVWNMIFHRDKDRSSLEHLMDLEELIQFSYTLC